MHHQVVPIFGDDYPSTVLLSYEHNQVIPVSDGRAIARCILTLAMMGWFNSTATEMATSIPMAIIKTQLSSANSTALIWLDQYNRAEIMHHQEDHLAKITLI